MSGVAAIDPSLLARSRDYCQRVTHAEARNFYYAMKLVPEPKRAAMFALYAWMRLVDDIADDGGGRTQRQRVDELEAWQAQTHTAINGQSADDDSHPVWAALAEMVRQHGVPPSVFDDAIEGQRQDLEGIRCQTFAELYEYCRRVAGTVGVASIYIWGFEGGDETVAMAVDRGVAFQLTNILRDLLEDRGRGRVYLPQEELAAMGVTDEFLRLGGGEFEEMMRFQIGRAEEYYRKSAELESRIKKDCRPALVAMTRIYHGLLEKIAADPGVVLRRRVSLSWLSKLMIGWRALRAR
jgi:phytoene synthase